MRERVGTPSWNTPTPSGLTAISKGLHLADEDLPVQRLDGIGPSAQLGASALRKDQPFVPCSRASYAGILYLEATGSRTDLGKGQKMFEGLASRQERNELLDELFGDLDSPYSQSMGNKLEGFAFETDAPSGNAPTSPDQEAA